MSAAIIEVDTVSIVTGFDLIIIRFAQLLASASENKITFSSRVYGHLTGQLPTNGQDNSSVPTTEENFEDRVFMCLNDGSFAVERALMVYKSSPQRSLRKLSLLVILANITLMSLFVELTVSIFVELRLNSGTRFTTVVMMQDFEATRKHQINTAASIASAPLGGIEDGSLNGVQQTLDYYKQNGEYVKTCGQTHDKPLTEAEVEQYKKLQTSPMPRLHHMLRMSMDAALVDEDALMFKKYADGTPQHVWDIPVDVPPDSLLFHIRGPLAQALLFVLMHTLAVGTAVRKATLTAKYSNVTECLAWVLDGRMRTVFFVNMVASHYHSQLAASKAISVRSELISRMRQTFNDLTCWFAQDIDGSFDITPWVQQTRRR